MCTSADPKSACQISKFQNFHNFLNFHQPKGCFLSDRQKSPEFYAIKTVNKKRSLQLYLKKKKKTAPPGTADPKKVKKVDGDFCQFFSFDFCVRLLDAVRKFERLIVQK
jgi:hypothetical protein